MNLTPHAPSPDRPPMQAAARGLQWLFTLLVTLSGLLQFSGLTHAQTTTPTLSVNPASTTVRQTVTADISNLDPTLTYTLDWGDGRTEPLTGNATAQFTNRYSQTGTYSVTLTEPSTPTVTATVSVGIATPTLNATANRLTATLSVSNVVIDYAYLIDWGDGTTGTTYTNGDPTQVTHDYTQPGTYTIQVTPQGGSPATITVTVAYPNPALNLIPGSATVFDTVTADLSDLEPTLTYSLDWGDGSAADTTTGAATAQKTHAYTGPGTFTVTVTSSGTTPVTGTVSVTVPTLTASAAGNGLSATLNLGNLLVGYSYSVNWGDNVTEPLTATATTAQLTHPYNQPGTVTIQVTPQGGAPITTTATLTVPDAILSVAPASAPAGQTVTANLSDLTSKLTYTLDWGDNTAAETITGTATAQKTHAYAQPGTYTVMLTSPGTTPVTATVNTTVPAPTASATGNGLTATLNLGNLLSGYAYSVAWGDGTTATLSPTAATAQLTHTYTQPGTVTIQVTPQGGVTVTTSVTLSAPTPTLTVTPSSAQIRQTVTADLNNLVPAVTYTLDWGDNTATETITGTATAQKTHTYATPDTFTVKLTSSATTPVTATVSTTVPGPTASATSSNLTATLNLGNLLSGYAYSVAWGDGTTEGLTPTAATAQLTRTYGRPGGFTIQVTPQGGAPVATTVTLKLPTATLNVTARRLDAAADLAQLVAGQSYSLNWGDGTTDTVTPTGTTVRLTHPYAQPGSFTLRLTAQGMTPVNAPLQLSAPPALSVEATGLTVTATVSQLVPGLTYTVAWADGKTESLTATAAQATLTHAYARPGTYAVRVSMSTGERADATVTVTAPAATLTVTPTDVAVGQPVTATLSGLTPSLTYALAWGDGTTETLTGVVTATRTHLFTDGRKYLTGTFTVTLSAQGVTPVTATVTASIPSPALSFTQDGLRVTLTVGNLIPVSSSDFPYTVEWGDGSVQTFVSPGSGLSEILTHDYASNGTYTVTVRNAGGGAPAQGAVTLNDQTPVPTLSFAASDLRVNLTVGNLLRTTSSVDSYRVDWGDGTTETFLNPNGNSTVTLVHAYVRPGTFRVEVRHPRVSTLAVGSVTVTVPGATLTVTPTGAAVGQTITSSVTGMYPGQDYGLDWGDGVIDTLSGSADAGRTHTYAVAGTYGVTLILNGVTVASATVTVTVPTPTGTAAATAPLTATLNLGSLLPGYEYTVTWDSGVTEVLTAAAAAASLTHTYPRPGQYGISVLARGSQDAFSTGVTVVAPVPVLTVTPASVVLGTPVTADLSNLMAGQYSLEWGDGSVESVTVATGGGAAQRTHVYAALGGYTVTLTSQYTVAVTSAVTVTAPAPVLEVTPVTVFVRDAVTARLSTLVPGVTYTLDWSDGTRDTVSGNATARKTHVYAQPGSYAVTLSSAQTAPVVVTVTATVPAPTAAVSGDNQLTVTLTLGRLLGGDTYTVAWGDGSTGTLTATGASATLTHTYDRPGTFTVQVTRPGVTPVTADVTVGAPQAVLTVSPQEDQNRNVQVTVGQTVTADLSSLISTLSYTLDWGDGVTETITGVPAARRTHVYLTEGLFKIGAVQAQGYGSRDYLVNVTLPAPVFTVSADRLDGAAVLTRLIPVVTYAFDWGDGRPAVTVTGVETATLTHRYGAPGTYDLLLKASDRVGVRRSLTVGVPAATLTLSGQGLSATASLAGLEPELTYALAWGDGTTESLTGVTVVTRTHTYALPGTYPVTLTGAPGAAVTAVAQDPVLTVTATNLSATAELSGLLPGVRYLLEWGDGQGQYLGGQGAATVTNVYRQPGTYTVRIAQVPTDRLPGIPGASAPLTVGLPPRETVQVLSVDDGGAGYHFRVSGLLPEATYRVDYGDGVNVNVRLSGVSEATLDYTYTSSGTYALTLQLEAAPDLVLRATSVQQVRIPLKIGGAALLFTQPDRTTDLKLGSTGPFSATLTVAYRGGGRLTGRWLLDGVPAGSVDVALPEAQGAATLPVVFTHRETRPGRHTLGFEWTGPVAAPPVRALTYSLNAPDTLTYGDFKLKVRTVTDLLVVPGRDSTVSGTGTLTLTVGGSPAGDVEVTFTGQQVRDTGTVSGGPAVTADLNGQTVRSARLGDLTLRVDRLTLDRDGGRLSGSVTLPVPGGSPVTLTFADTPVSAGSGDLTAALRLGSPVRNVRLPEDGLSLSADAALLDLSASSNPAELAAAYRDQAAPQPDWMGLIFPAAQLTVGAPILTAPVTVTRSAAYNVSGYATAFDLKAVRATLLGWTVDIESLQASVLAGRISATTGAGSVELPLVNERLNVKLGWTPEAQPGARLTPAPDGRVKVHSFGRTSLALGEGTWTAAQGQGRVVFANARWFLDSAGNDLPLNNLTLTGDGAVSLGGKAWATVTGTTSLTVLGYPLAAAEVGVERQSGGGYTLGLNGRLQVNEKLPVNTTNTRTLFWVRDGKDVNVTTESLRAANAIYDVTLNGALDANGMLVFTGGGRLKLLGLLEADAKATFGRYTGPASNYAQPSGAASVGYGSILFHLASGLDKLTVGVKNVEIYELFGGYTVNMDWPAGLDRSPVFRTAGPFEAVQAGLTASMLVEAATDSDRQGLPDPPKTYIRGIATGKGGQGNGGVDITADLWVVPDGEKWNRAAPQGRAKLDITNQGGVLMQACVGSGAVVAAAGLDCSRVAPLQFGSVVTLTGFLEQYAGPAGSHLYIGTDRNPVTVQLAKDPAGSGYLMIDPGRVRFGVGVSKSFAFEGSRDFFLCTARYGVSGKYTQNLDLGVQYAPFVLDGRAAFKAGASVYASCGRIGATVGLTVGLDGKVRIASDGSSFQGKASGSIDISGIPDINFSTDVTLKF